jgi:hypothetical protein
MYFIRLRRCCCRANWFFGMNAIRVVVKCVLAIPSDQAGTEA